MTAIGRVGVAGGGLMGSGIAQVCAQAGIDVRVLEVDRGAAERSVAAIARSLHRAVERGKLSAGDAEAAQSRVSPCWEPSALGDCDLVIEAIVESLEAKRTLWRTLDAVASAQCLFATNTSSLAVCDQAVVTGRPDRFVGLHFFNPVPAMPLVEVVRTVTTSEATLAAARAFVQRIGKTAIEARDTPGFIVNRLLVPYLLDAVRAYEAGIATVADIDAGMTLGAGLPMGPLALCDYVGLDTLERVGGVLYEAFRDARHAPPPLLHRMVVSGWLGRKSGLGFYDHSTTPPTPREIQG